MIFLVAIETQSFVLISQLKTASKDDISGGLACKKKIKEKHEFLFFSDFQDELCYIAASFNLNTIFTEIISNNEIFCEMEML